MKKWKKTKVSDFLFEREGKYKPNATKIAGLKRIEKIDFQGNFYIANKSSQTNMILVNNGDLVISGINVSKGALGIYEGKNPVTATIHYSSYTYDKNQINVEYLKLFLKSPKFLELLKEQVRGGIKTEIKPKHILDLEIPLPSIHQQEKIAEQFRKIEVEDCQLRAEISRQNSLLKKLRQRILQDAVEGKLTVGWRKDNSDVESANDLLYLISSKKETLLKNKRFKKEKFLSPITEKEKPFLLPKGWVWCRLGDLYEIVRGSSPRPKGDPRFWTKSRTAYHWITIADFTPFGRDNTLFDTKGFLTEEGSKHSRKVKATDLLVACSGVGSVGRSIRLAIEGYIYDGLLAIRNIEDNTIREYLSIFLKFKEAQIYSIASGANWLNINIDLLSNYLLALPPKKEMEAIVKKFGVLKNICDQLEVQIAKNKVNAHQLMQEVLKEAFTQTGYETNVSDNIIEFKLTSYEDTNDNRNMLLAAEIVHQLHKEATLGHKKLQKVFYLCQKTQNLNLPTNFKQHAAGPYDYDLARDIDSDLQKSSWFEFRQNARLKYKPLSNAGSHKEDFRKHFKNELLGINRVISLFKTKTSDEAEAVATLYACWEEIKHSKSEFSKSALIEKFYAWSEEKRKFSKTQLDQVIIWMEKNKVYPG